MRISFAEASEEEIGVVKVGPRQYRLKETPISADPALYLGDVIEVSEEEDRLVFERRVSKSSLNTSDFLVPREFSTLPAYKEFLARIEALGGAWEQVYGGI